MWGEFTSANEVSKNENNLKKKHFLSIISNKLPEKFFELKFWNISAFFLKDEPMVLS